jgi:hypothetical protein
MSQRFSASVAGRLMACHASAHLDLAIPNWQEPARDDTVGMKAVGTSVHKIIQDLIEIRYVTATKTQKFTASDMRAMGRALTYIGEVWGQRRFQVAVEETVEADWLQSKPKTTADLVFYTKDQLDIVDTKWGKIRVEVIDNEQLLFYAASYAHLAPKAKGVTLHIVQPRADNLESWYVTTDEIRQFMDEAIKAEAAIAGGSVAFGPGDHCTFCPANPHSRGDKGKPLCPAQMQLLYPNHVDEDAILALI